MRASQHLTRLPLLLVLLFPGCSESDASRIGKVSGKALERAEKVTDQAGQKMGLSLQRAERQMDSRLEAVKPGSDGSDLSQRVQTRLKWDDLLEDATIRVRSDKNGVITLSGKVNNEMQRRRAIVLAESTQGVKKVIDGMELDAGEK
jgi:osmotically-inducible protein OsmY